MAFCEEVTGYVDEWRHYGGCNVLDFNKALDVVSCGILFWKLRKRKLKNKLLHGLKIVWTDMLKWY